MKFTKEMRVARESKGITQSEMARLIGTSQTSYLRWGKGYYDIPQEYVKKICEVLEIPYDNGEDMQYKVLVIDLFNKLPIDIKLQMFRTFIAELQQYLGE